MGKFLLGVFIGIVITIFGLFIVVLAIGRLFSTKQPTVASGSALTLTLDGDIPEAAPVDISIPFIQQQSAPTVRDIWTSLRAAATDSRIKAVVLEPRNLLAGWGKLQEIRQDLLDFKKSGKPVYALLQSPGSHEYYLASVADKVFLSPTDMLNVKGFRLAELYFKGTLDKLGVGVQVGHIGRYKDAGDIFTRTNMSPETRDVLNQVLDQIYNDFCFGIAQSRHKSVSDVQALIDQGPFEAPQAKANGLIDELGYEDEVYADLKKKLNVSDLKKTDIRAYFRAEPGRGDRIAFLVGEGDIVQGQGANGLGDEAVIASLAFEKTIEQVKNDSSVKGVILRVDSPGGDAVASDEILHALKLLARAKPLVVSMSDVAASGGYYISMTGDTVMAYPDTLTGSIGVLYVRPNVHGLFDKLGIQEDALSRGKLANMDSIYDPLSDGAQEKMQESIAATYHVFVTKVATARRRTYDQIEPVAQGRVWMGAQARQNGLVDQLGSIDDAVALVRQKAHLPATGATNLVMFPPRRSLFDVLANVSSDSAAEKVAELKLRKTIPQLPGPAFLKGGALEIFPYRITVQ